MMRKPHTLRGSRAAAAVLALAFVAIPAGASAHQPDDDCTRAQSDERAHFELIAAVAPMPAAAPIVDVAGSLEAANVVIARRAESELARSIRRERRVLDRLQIGSTFEQARHLEVIEQLHGAMAWDRDVDIDRAVGGDVSWHFETVDLRDEPAGPWETVSDVIVTAARFPARAGIVVKHLVGAAAKLTPRVARALF